MKLFLKSTLLLFTVLILSKNVSAQSQPQYAVTVNQKEGKRITGRLVAINDSSVVIAAKEYRNEIKKDVILLNNISAIKVRKHRSGTVFSVVTGAAVAGNIALAITQLSGTTAVAVATGGTIGIVLLSVAIYKLATPPLEKLSSSDGLTYEKVNETFKVYIDSNPVPTAN